MLRNNPELAAQMLAQGGAAGLPDPTDHIASMPSLEEIDAWSPVQVRLFDTWRPTMEAMARLMVDCIKANNAAGRITTLILPVGPTEQYPIAAEISNRERVSWRNVWTFNMDEYLDWEGRPIPEDHPMSFHGAMKRDLFDRLDPDLRIPEAQRWFPDPFAPDAIDAKTLEKKLKAFKTKTKKTPLTISAAGQRGIDEAMRALMTVIAKAKQIAATPDPEKVSTGEWRP